MPKWNTTEFFFWGCETNLSIFNNDSLFPTPCSLSFSSFLPLFLCLYLFFLELLKPLIVLHCPQDKVRNYTLYARFSLQPHSRPENLLPFLLHTPVIEPLQCLSIPCLFSPFPGMCYFPRMFILSPAKAGENSHNILSSITPTTNYIVW